MVILSDEERNMVEKLLESHCALEIIQMMMKSYAMRSPDCARELIAYNNDLADTIVVNMKKKTDELFGAAFWLICQRKMDRKDLSSYFASVLPVCKAMFPTGKADGGNLAEKEYFDQFKTLLKNPNAFSWENDKAWADHMGYTEYLKLVEKNMEDEDGKENR